jgi:hypothetical protein
MSHNQSALIVSALSRSVRSFLGCENRIKFVAEGGGSGIPIAAGDGKSLLQAILHDPAPIMQAWHVRIFLWPNHRSLTCFVPHVQAMDVRHPAGTFVKEVIIGQEQEAGCSTTLMLSLTGLLIDR